MSENKQNDIDETSLENVENTEQMQTAEESETLSQQKEDDGEKNRIPDIVVSEEDIKKGIVQPLLRFDLYSRIINNMLDNVQIGSEQEKSLREHFEPYFGKDFDWSQLPANISDERLQNVAQDYLNEKINDVITNAFSMKPDDINGTFDSIYAYVGLNIDLSTVEKNICRKIFYNRTAEAPELQDAYKILTIGCDLYNTIVSDNISTSSKIEVENKVQQIDVMYAQKKLTRDHMAMFYHNVAVFYEKLALNKSSQKNVTNERVRANDYMKKALVLTSDIKLINVCAEFLPETTNNLYEIICEACDRALEKNNDPISLCNAHIIYSKALLKKSSHGGFNSAVGEMHDEAIYHYKEAFQYAQTDDKKSKILRNIANLQKKNNYFDEYIQTRIELAEHYLTGKTKVRDYMNLATEVKDANLKTFLLETAINELIDASNIKAEERALLLNNIAGQLKKLYTPKDEEKLKILNALQKKYGKSPQKKQPVFTRMSSKGNDYFSK